MLVLSLLFLFEPSFFCAFLSWLSLFLATLYDMSTLICKLSSSFVADLNLRPCWLKIECVDLIENPHQMWHHFTNKIDENSWTVMLDLPYFPPGSTFPEPPAQIDAVSHLRSRRQVAARQGGDEGNRAPGRRRCFATRNFVWLNDIP